MQYLQSAMKLRNKSRLSISEKRSTHRDLGATLSFALLVLNNAY